MVGSQRAFACREYSMRDAEPTLRLHLRGRSALLLGGLLVALGLVEGALWLIGFEYRLYPLSIEFGFPNPEAFKNYFKPHDRFLWVQQDYEKKLDRSLESRPHLVLTGCSTTEWGAFDRELQKRVKNTPGASPLTFTNLAVSGWSSHQGLLQMKSDVVALAPKVVTIFFGWNDHWMGFGLEDKKVSPLTSSPLLVQLQRLRTMQLMSKAIVSRKARLERSERAGSNPERVSLEDFRRNLEQMVAVAREHDIVPVLLTAPTSHKKGEEPQYLDKLWLEDLTELVPKHQRYVEVVREVAGRKDVALCDLAAQFARLPRPELLGLMKKDGIHFSAAGGVRVGAMLHSCLARYDLLP